VNHLTEEQLVLFHFGDIGESPDAASIEEHVHACAECRAELDDLRHVLSAVSSLPMPDRPDHYGTEVWARIQPSLVRRGETWRERLPGLFVGRRLVLGGALAVLVIAAFVAGRFSPWPRPAGSTSPAQAPAAGPQSASADREQVRERILLVAVGDHLERSQVALVELVNNPGGPSVDISNEQERARDLVTENRLYRQTALTTGEPGVASVLDDLERVLMEVANSPSPMSASEFDRVRKRIEQQGIIFKVRVFGERVRERETGSVANAGVRG
jgi:hypothetical protein